MDTCTGVHILRVDEWYCNFLLKYFCLLFLGDMMVTNPGYEVPPARGSNKENPFASGGPALVYQNVSYQPNQQMNMYQPDQQLPEGNTYHADNQKEQLVPKSYI